MTSSPSSIDERWDVQQTLDWLQCLQERQRRRRRTRRRGNGEASDSTSAAGIDVDADDDTEPILRRVVLQFPDALLPVALAVQSRLDAGAAARGLDLEFFVLADSTFNPAAVDELAAIRGGGDAVVHYGRAEAPLSDSDDEGEEEEGDATGEGRASLRRSRSSSCSLPTLFVFGKDDVDVAAVARSVVEHAASFAAPPGAGGGGGRSAVAAVVVLPDQPLCHAAGSLRSAIAEEVELLRRDREEGSFPEVVVAEPTFRAIEPRRRRRRTKEENDDDETTVARADKGFDARRPSSRSTLSGLTWSLSAPAAAASCAFAWVGPAGDDDGTGGRRGGDGDGGDDDGACASARQLLRLTLSPSSPWSTVSPLSGRLDTPPPLGARRALGRRYFAVQKAANASLVGVVVATAAGGKLREGEPRPADEERPGPDPLPAHVRASDALLRLARASGKRAYSLSMGRPTAAKLSNFPELDCFVLVAPPGAQLPAEGSLDVSVPVLTPAEAVIAWGCGKAREKKEKEEGEDDEGEEEDDGEEDDEDDDPASRWDPTAYSLDSLPAVALAAERAADELERRRARRESEGRATEAAARLSLVDGASYSRGAPPPSSSYSAPYSSSLAVRRDGSLSNAPPPGGVVKRDVESAADFLSSRRSWRGLETPATGGVAPLEASGVVEGRSGRAAGYEGEGGS